MEEIKVVPWQDIQGNRYIKSLNPSMLTKEGYLSTMRARVIGKPKTNSDFVTIKFDRDYVLLWLATKVIKPLTNEGIDGVNELLKEAWKKSGISPHSLRRDLDRNRTA